MNDGGNGSDHRKDFVPGFKGKTHSKEARKRMSENRRGIPVSEETKKKLSAAMKGKHISETHRMKLLEGHRKKCSKPVLMFNRDGDFVAEFPSIKDAAAHIGVARSQVSAVLRGKHKTAAGGYDRNAGYTFRYKNENPDR